MKFLITGSSGFVGKNLLSFLSNNYGQCSFDEYIRGSDINSFLDNDVVVHLAGKAHDIVDSVNSADYYRDNTELTKTVFDAFLKSDIKVFITLSSVKAVADKVEGVLTEEFNPNPSTHYGKSKLLAEQYILSKELPRGKRFYILRPCMIHGPGNKGNLNLLYQVASIGCPWPLGAYSNQRSYCSVNNLIFVIKELIDNENIPSGIYNVSDDEPLSTNEVISIIGKQLNKRIRIWNVPKIIIVFLAKFCDVFNFALTTERLHKITDSYIVSNKKIQGYMSNPFPVTAREGLFDTFETF